MPQLNKQTIFIYEEAVPFLELLFFLFPFFLTFTLKMLFEDTKVAFSLKSNAELDRAFYLFKMISHQPLVRIGSTVAQIAINSKLPVEGLIRTTVFDHFCAGTSAEESLEIVKLLYSANVHSVLDYSVEGAKSEISLDACLENTIKAIEFSASTKALPFSVFKPSGFGDFDLYLKRSEGHPLNKKELAAWERVRQRFYSCCNAAKIHKVKLLIDAEESWIQPAVNELVEEMMQLFNQNEVVVYTTAQMYLSSKLAYLKELFLRAEKWGFKVGVKLVRGAYLEKESSRAAKNNYTNPVCKSKSQTDKNFNEAIRFLLEHLDRFALYLGSHNEKSTYFLLDQMKKRNISKRHPHIWFGQLYGMSDHISFNLAKEGYQVSKYLPYGPVKDVLPYLIRRAEENTSVAGQTLRELELIERERVRRKKT